MPNSIPFSCYLIGEGTLLIRCAELLRKRGHQILGVLSAHPAVLVWSSSTGTRQLLPTENWTEILRSEPFDYLFSIVNFKVLPPEVFKLPRRAAINFHDSLLPQNAGFHAASSASTLVLVLLNA